MIHLQRGINFLEIEVSDITAGRSGQDISLIDELFIKIHGNMVFDLTVFDLLVILPDFQFGIFKRIIGDLEEFRMFSDPGDIFGCDLFPIADTDLDEIGRILRFTVIIKFHREYLRIHYTTIYNAVQHTYNKIKRKFENLGGVRNAGKVIPIPSQFRVSQLSTKMVDNQFFELQGLTARHISNAFGVKGFQLNDLEKSSYSSIYEQNRLFYSDTLQGVLTEYEQEIDYKLLTGEDREKNLYSKFNIDALLRADIEARYNAYAAGIKIHS